MEPLRSANSTVTCLRSPSRAALEVRIFSARCFGVYDEGDFVETAGTVGPTPTPSPCPHFLQNLWVGALVVPQPPQTIASFAPHSGQKSASEGVSCWHLGHFI